MSRTERASAWNYAWVLLGLVGGVVGWLLIRDRDPDRARGVLITGTVLGVGSGLLVLAVNLLALGATTAVVSGLSNGTKTSTYQASPTPTGGKKMNGFTSVREWTWSRVQAGGYTQRSTFAIGNPVAASDSPYFDSSDGVLTVGDACGVTTGRDAVVPFTVDVTNTTSGFDATVAERFVANADTEKYYANSGATCDSAGEMTSFHSTAPEAPSEGTQQRGFLILSDYFTPDYPAGDPNVFAALRVEVASTATSDDSGTWQLTDSGVSGPGSFVAGWGDTPNAFTLSGRAPSR